MSQSDKMWDATTYDNKLSFVSELGKNIFELLEVQKGEKVLDLGCGTGDLAAIIQDRGAFVHGIDMSESMIQQARQKYPSHTFSVADAQTFSTPEQYDAVFSNAALHWMKQPEQTIASIWMTLRSGGRFVAEFGGKGNIHAVYQAVVHFFERHGMDAVERNPWYFPTIGEYSGLLEGQGFRVTYARHFDRPTPLAGGEQAIIHWLNVFAAPFFTDCTAQEKSQAFEEIASALEASLYREGQWIVDYSRVQFIAYKP
ncbi:class I SAM-dependent methyltransferase [Brevibacillus migulae]|uniref:class I SAM-dependent methyltransferase n=1 Tax=Brevibacillus migulae TaxID=1644114 RepID=UPI00106E6F9B|nr:class I SAM-dependent methyltransferase [Brevibacillus migulae]